jgi:hypothetical protein
VTPCAVPPGEILAPNEAGLPENARVVLRILLLLAPVRQGMAHLDDRDYLKSCYELMSKGLMEIVQLPNQNFVVRLTPLGHATFGAGQTVQ